MKKFIVPFILIVATIGFLVWVLWQPPVAPKPSSQLTLSPTPETPLKVVAGFYPLAEFARMAGGDRVQVEILTPAGGEPHDFEPTPEDVARLFKADVVLLNGAGLDPWGERLAPELRASGVVVLSMADQVEVVDSDPHFWLNPSMAAQEVRAIAEALALRDPEHVSVYARQSQAAEQVLENLDEAYRARLTSCAKDTVVTSHEAFSYVARAYGFTAHAIAGLSPEEEPSAGSLNELVQFMNAKGLSVILLETTANPKVAQVLADEVGATTQVFHPLEGLTAEESARGETYLSLMNSNLTHLAEALVCP